MGQFIIGVKLGIGSPGSPGLESKHPDRFY